MNITIDVSQMCYSGTGVARYVRGLTQALLEANTKHTFTLYAGTLRQRSFFTKLSRISPWNRATWKILPIPPKLAGFALNSLSLPLERLTGSTDLLHFSDWSEPATHLPAVTTVHDLAFRLYPETVDPLIRTTQARRLARLVKSSTHIIADSRSTKNDLVKIYGIETARVTVIYPGLDVRYKPQSKTEVDRVKKKYHLPAKYILSLGTQEPRKNIARLVEAVKSLDLPLVIVGKHGWGEKTASLGFVPESDLPGLYGGAHVFCFPSLYEGFGFPVLEAMACGVPVVTSNISSLPEVGGNAAVLIDPQSVESIKQGIIQADQERVSRIKTGLLQAKKFSWEQTAKQVLEVYEQTAKYRG